MVADQFRQRVGVDGDHGQAGRHCFHRGEALQLRLGRDGEDVGQPVEAGQVRSGDKSEESHLPGQAQPLRVCSQPGLFRAGAGHGDPRAGVSVYQLGRGVQQDVDAFLGAEPADRQDQRTAGGQSVALPDLAVGRTRRVRAQVDAVRDHPGRDA